MTYFDPLIRYEVIHFFTQGKPTVVNDEFTPNPLPWYLDHKGNLKTSKEIDDYNLFDIQDQQSIQTKIIGFKCIWDDDTPSPSLPSPPDSSIIGSIWSNL